MKIYETTSEAYLGSLADVYDNPDFVSSPRGQRTREKLDYCFRVTDPTTRIIITKDPERNKVIEDYTIKECELYDSMTNLAIDFGTASKFWLKLANPDGTVNSGYGYNIWKKESHGNDFELNLVEHPQFTTRAEQQRVLSGPHEMREGKVFVHRTKMRTPWEWAKESLVRDKDTRQAILRFNLPEHAGFGNKDFTCTMHGIFLIREDKLNFSVNMRSNDLTLGLVYDMPWFVSLMYRMRDELKDVYPELKIGYYTHNVHSLHIYDRDEEKILKMLGR